MAARVYLDHNATTAVKPDVWEAIEALPALPYNPSSVHSYGREARRLVEEARKRLLQAVGADDSYQCVFTASGSEANNLALKGVVSDLLLVSAIEHASVLQCEHATTKLIPVTEAGIVDVTALEAMLAEATGTVCISVMLANNETGIIQPIIAIAALAARYHALLHCDAVQAFGKIAVDIKTLGIDMLTLSAHKCGGLLGAAALVVKKKIALKAVIQGGGQERGMRSGTENVPAIVGFGTAAMTAEHYNAARIAMLRDRLEEALPKAVIIGKDQQRLPNTSMMIMPAVSSEVQIIDFDLQGIAISAGSACSSGKVTVSHVLLAMGVTKAAASCAIRVSLGESTIEDDIKQFIAVWNELYSRQSKHAANVF